MKQEKNRGLLIVFALVVLLGGILCNGAVKTVHAEDEGTFLIEAQMLPSDKQTYDIRLTVENLGEDWEGTVRLIVNEDYRQPCAYDTALSLPQGSKKQFVVKVPVNSIDNTDGTIVVTLLNRRGGIAAVKEFKRLMVGQLVSLSMGILSDAYQELTYMDMGGAEIYFYGDSYPIKLVELQQGNLVDVLDTLTFLVIDQYNTGILTQDELDAIASWIIDGGVFIIGTGAYAEDTLRGFDGGYPDISCKRIYTLDDASDFDAGAYLDWSKLTMAELQGMHSINPDYNTGGWCDARGHGSVSALPYSLAELGRADDIYLNIDQENFVMQILEEACYNADSRYSSSVSGYDDYSWDIRRLLGMVGSSNSILNFGVLKAIVILYVIFVGPVLYLILRTLKRRELYWIAVPVTALFGIGLIFFAGRGSEIVRTKVYSVTVNNLSNRKEGGTYLYCYDADRSEWELKLDEGYDYAGPFSNKSYYYYNSADDVSYYYHIRKEGDNFSLGIKPSSNFEDSYFYLGGVSNNIRVEGRFTAQNISTYRDSIRGTVVNDTNMDMDYFAVLWNDSVHIFSELPAGASCDLDDAEPLYTMLGFSYFSYTYNFLDSLISDGEREKAGALSALGVGMCDVSPRMEQDTLIVIGVVENWDKTVDDNCNEMSYGCFYSIQ